jgi:hypothetical protein
MNKSFIEWLRLYCSTQFDVREGNTDIYWILVEDIHPWDGASKILYTDEEIYEHWETKIKTT